MSLSQQTLDNITAARTKDTPPTRYRVPFRNIRDVMSLHARTSPRKTFLIAYDANPAGDDTRLELDFREFVSRVHQVANLLYDDLGIRRGDRIATIGHNHSDIVLIYFACWVIGATVVPQNVAEDDHHIAYILRNSQAKLCFVMSDYLDRAERIIHGDDSDDDSIGVPGIQGIIQVGGERHDDYLLFHEVVRSRPMTFLGDESGAKSDDIPLQRGNEHTPTLEDEALLVYTSGTTGAPKGVVLTQYNLLIDAQGMAHWQAITGNQRLMCVLPIHHVNGIVVTLMMPLIVGGSVVLNRGFSVTHFWERIARERVSIVSGVPTLLQFLVEHARKLREAGETIFGHKITRRDLTRFRHVICGAGTLSVTLAQEFEDMFGFPIIHGYGLSETTAYACFLPVTLSWDEHRAWMQDHGYPSIGCAIDTNEIAIFDPDGSGRQLAARERGEICIRGHNVMKYYFQRDDANDETFKFGWFRSGDEGFFQTDSQGRKFFFITGRIKELINRGGVKYSPFDIEEVLLAIPGVKIGLAIGFENIYYGEEVGAYIVPEPDTTLDPDAILEHCRHAMPFEKSPKVVVFGDDVPVTSTGKYQRLKLRDHFLAHRDTQFRPD